MINNAIEQAAASPLILSRAQRLVIATACVIGLLFSLPVKSVSGEEQGLWRTAQPLPYHVQEIYPAVFDGHIVVAGGLSPDVDENDIGVSDRVVIYSLQEQRWKPGPALPEPRHHPMLAVVGNRLLSFGGFVVDEQGAWHNSTDVMELVADSTSSKQGFLAHGTWKKIAQLPAPLAETLSAVHNGKVHLVTGRTPSETGKNSQWIDQSDVATHLVFDPQTLTWSEAKPVPTARNSACSVQTKGKLHTIAGRTVKGGNLATHEAYDFGSGQWETLAPLPDAQGGLACATSGGRIYVFGGEYFDNGGGVYADVWEYDIAADAWRSVSRMPNPRHGLGALSIDGDIYVVAGASQAGGNQTSDAMSVFSPKQLKRE